MNMIAFDTHTFIKRITAAGMPEPQAEVLADVLAERPVPATKGAINHAIATLGRAVDKRLLALENGQTELKAGLAELRTGQTELKIGLADHSAKLSSLEKGQAELKIGLADHSAKLSSLEKGQA
ncbi:MAG: hypothetical protein WCK65_11230, partial [Rhodospirillaceae bacterium]